MADAAPRKDSSDKAAKQEAAKVPKQEAAKAATPPSKPAPQPAGDALRLMDLEGATYDVLEDGQGIVTLPAEQLHAGAERVKNLGYRILSVLSGYDRGDHFGVFYAFVKPASAPTAFAEFRLRVVLPKKVGEAVVEPVAPSLAPLFPAADWHEREMYDMYGIRFVGHPDLRRMFLPEDWTGYPARRDYKEPEQFVALRDGEDVVVKTEEPGAW